MIETNRTETVIKNIYLQICLRIWIVFPYLQVLVIYLIKENSPIESYFVCFNKIQPLQAFKMLA